MAAEVETETETEIEAKDETGNEREIVTENGMAIVMGIQTEIKAEI